MKQVVILTFCTMLFGLSSCVAKQMYMKTKKVPVKNVTLSGKDAGVISIPESVTVNYFGGIYNEEDAERLGKLDDPGSVDVYIPFVLNITDGDKKISGLKMYVTLFNEKKQPIGINWFAMFVQDTADYEALNFWTISDYNDSLQDALAPEFTNIPAYMGVGDLNCQRRKLHLDLAPITAFQKIQYIRIDSVELIPVSNSHARALDDSLNLMEVWVNSWRGDGSGEYIQEHLSSIYDSLSSFSAFHPSEKVSWRDAYNNHSYYYHVGIYDGDYNYYSLEQCERYERLRSDLGSIWEEFLEELKKLAEEENPEAQLIYARCLNNKLDYHVYSHISKYYKYKYYAEVAENEAEATDAVVVEPVVAEDEASCPVCLDWYVKSAINGNTEAQRELDDVAKTVSTSGLVDYLTYYKKRLYLELITKEKYDQIYQMLKPYIK